MKHTQFFTLLVTLVTISVTQASSSQFFDALDGQFDASQYLSENAYGFLPVPVIITDPAVDGGLGMIGLFFHESDDEKEERLKAMRSTENASRHLMPPSVSALIGVYTGNDSYFAGGGHMGFFNQGKIRYMGGGGYGNVNLDFYGAGNIEFNRPISLNTSASAVMQTLKFKIANTGFYVGPTHRYIKAEIKPTNVGDLISGLPPVWEDKLTELFTNEVTSSGAGFAFEYDSRNNFFSPETGLKYELNYLWFDEKIGSDVDYQLTELTALHYFRLAKKWRTAFRVEVNYADTAEILPPYAIPSVSLRGIPSARYQGNSTAVTELELIYELNFRWSINAFAGIGKASNSFSDLNESESLVSKGAGFRYLVARRYGFNMGVDIAKGPEDTVFYIQAGSAW
jgi:hypothetical protein